MLSAALRPVFKPFAFLSRPVLRLDLAPGQLLPARRVKAGTPVHCVRGRVWLSMSGELEDVILRAGEGGTVLKNGSLLAQGLAPAPGAGPAPGNADWVGTPF